MKKQKVETLPEKPIIKTQLAGAIENLFNEKMENEFQKIENEVPENIDSPESALLVTQTVITDIWNKEISPILNGLIKVWEKSFSDDPAEAHLKKIFSKSRELELKIKIMYFSELLEVREILPEVWESLVRISMLHQQWKMKLMAKWLEKIPEEKFHDSGVDKAQLEIALEVANGLGPLFGQIYLMQMNNDYHHLLPYKVTRPMKIIKLMKN